MASIKAIFTTSLLAAADLVAGHGAIKTVGDPGGESMVLDIDTSTPRDGTRRNPFQQNSKQFKGDTFGETVGAGTTASRLAPRLSWLRLALGSRRSLEAVGSR